jgi:hypothetical protein
MSPVKRTARRANRPSQAAQIPNARAFGAGIDKAALI